MSTTNQKSISIVAADLDAHHAHQLLQSVVIPRPIGWISTIGAGGAVNLAPFSCFGAVSSYPATIMVSMGQRKGEPKDTLRNIQETGEFVTNLVDERLVEAMNLTAGDYPYDVDEFEVADLPLAPSVDVRPPRVASSPAAMEARVVQIIPIPDSTTTLVIGRVLRFHLREGLLRPDMTVDPELARPVARLSRDDYTTLGRVFSLARPKVD